MSGVMKYSSIVAKIHAMRAKLLTEEDYIKLASMNNVLEIIHYLNDKTPYGKFIAMLDEASYHRGNIEKVLTSSLYDDFSRLYKFADIDQKKFLKLLMTKYDTDLIKYCFDIVTAHEKKPFDIDYKKDFFNHFSDIDIEKMVMATNIEDVITFLRNTKYYTPLKRVSEASKNGEPRVFDYEIVLDLFAFKTMWSKRNLILNKKESEDFKKNVGTHVDLLNIEWIYRAKKYYDMSPIEIYALLIPINYRLSDGTIKELIEAPDMSSFFQTLNGTIYAKKTNFNEGSIIEQELNFIVHELFMKAWRYNPYSVSSLYGYLYFKEEEIRKITILLECKRYGLNEKETLDFIDRKYQRGGEA